MTRKTTTKPQAVPADDVDSTTPTSPFQRFNWTPDDLPHGTRVPASELCRLVDHVKDVTTGAALVFELMNSNSAELDSNERPYLNANHLGLLGRLAMRSLDSLDDRASQIAIHLHKLARGET